MNLQTFWYWSGYQRFCSWAMYQINIQSNADWPHFIHSIALMQGVPLPLSRQSRRSRWSSTRTLCSKTPGSPEWSCSQNGRAWERDNWELCTIQSIRQRHSSHTGKLFGKGCVLTQNILGDINKTCIRQRLDMHKTCFLFPQFMRKNQQTVVTARFVSMESTLCVFDLVHGYWGLP